MRIAKELWSLVDNEHGFVHKKLLGIGKFLVPKALGIIPGGGLVKTGLGIAGAALLGRSPGARPSMISEQQKQAGLAIKFEMPVSLGVRGSVPRALREFNQCMTAAGGNVSACLAEQARLLTARGANGGGGGGGPFGPCDDPRLIRGPAGNCIFPGSPVGAARFGGEAIMGQYGAGMVAGSQIVDRATCGRGMQLGNDGVCYNKSQISNKQRMWPAGRKPLLSGGDMRAISIAARAGRRLEGATKRLQRLGMMKKPARRALAPHRHAKAATGVVSV